MEQREIKFRVWSALEDKMHQCDMEEDFQDFFKHNDGITFMQFTGLLDKNGKEIYEGDIYQVAANKKYTVKFCNGETSLHEWYGGAFILWLNEETFFPFDEFAMSTGEVIGNVFQNPELL